MTRGNRDRLRDVEAACLDLRKDLALGGLDNGTVYGAVRLRLIEIGEAAKGIDDQVLDTEPEIPWRNIKGMRDLLVHRYFDTDRAIVQRVVDEQFEPLLAAVRRMIERVGDDEA